MKEIIVIVILVASFYISVVLIGIFKLFFSIIFLKLEVSEH